MEVGDTVIVHGHPLSPIGVITSRSPHHRDGWYVEYGCSVESPGQGYSMEGSNWDSSLLTLLKAHKGYLELLV